MPSIGNGVDIPFHHVESTAPTILLEFPFDLPCKKPVTTSLLVCTIFYIESVVSRDTANDMWNKFNCGLSLSTFTGIYELVGSQAEPTTSGELKLLGFVAQLNLPRLNVQP